jgi:quercetin dioxygenase-like cupin family protein
MSIQPLILSPEEYEQALNVLGTKVTVMVSNAVTKGHEITIQSGEEGSGPPPHSHNWHESFYVIKGKVEFRCGGSVKSCGPGTFVHVPAGMVHSFCYGAGGGEMLEIAGQGSSAAQMFNMVDAEIPADAPDIPKAVEILEKNGVSVAV